MFFQVIKFQSETITNQKDLNRFKFGLITLFNTQTIKQVKKIDFNIYNYNEYS